MPSGVIARWTAARPASAATASTATTIEAPIWPSRPWTLPAMIGSPSVSTPTSGAMVAVARTLTVEIRIPPKISGSASGSSTERTICVPDMPIPRAASTASRLTWRTPT
jgi:hypothetical protein